MKVHVSPCGIRCNSTGFLRNSTRSHTGQGRLRAFILMVALLSSCNNAAASSSPQTIFEMEMTENYDVPDPFINARLFSVSDKVRFYFL